MLGLDAYASSDEDDEVEVKDKSLKIATSRKTWMTANGKRYR